MSLPILAIVVPCFNEEKVLPCTAPVFLEKIRALSAMQLISENSYVLFCDDGSRDSTWEIIVDLAKANDQIHGLSLSRNRGHQNVLLAGLMHAKDSADYIVSIDCDGQDDINAIDEMICKANSGCDIVYGVRSKRDTDTWFKRTTAETFYKAMKWLGADIVYNHADYRLSTARVLRELEGYGEVNLFLRGMFPLVGFKSDIVYYERHERIAGESHYPILKILSFAWDGVTSLSVKPIRLICLLGFFMAFLSLLMIGWCLISYFSGRVVPGWASNLIVSCMIGGVQLISIGVIGEYVGKVYLETKHRPKFIVREVI